MESTKYLLRMSLKSVHSMRMCLTVSGHWQVTHSGWWLKKGWVPCMTSDRTRRASNFRILHFHRIYTFPPFLFLHRSPLSCQRRTWRDRVMQEYGKGNSRENRITRVYLEGWPLNWRVRLWSVCALVCLCLYVVCDLVLFFSFIFCLSIVLWHAVCRRRKLVYAQGVQLYRV